jgi:hypothetical protein
MGFSTKSQTVTGVGASSPIIFLSPSDDFVTLLNAYATGTVTYDIEYTIDDVELDNAQWMTLGDVDRTLSSDDSLYFPVRAVRVNITVGSGTVKLVSLYKD